MVKIKNFHIGKKQPLTIIAGPCVIENEKMIRSTAEFLKKQAERLHFQLIFKSSYRKANRTSIHSFSGLAFEEAITVLEKVGREFDLPLLTDVHSELEVPVVAQVVDVLQIPAFLCRQTDLLVAAGRTQKAVNIKKGQFMAPDDMKQVAQKISSTGNENILLTERGTTFGYHNLVVDMRSLIIMDKIGYPVVYDATHSLQLPGGLGSASGGQPEFILPMARAALSTAALSAIFMEVHPDPPHALSDAASQLSLDNFPQVAEQLLLVHEMITKLH